MRTPRKTKTHQAILNRSLTVGACIAPRPHCRFYIPEPRISIIRLRGVWLANLGFTPQKRVEVITNYKELIIRVVDEEEK